MTLLRLRACPCNRMENPQCTLRIASEVDLEDLLPMVGRYHETEGIVSSPSLRRGALSALIREPRYGLVWLIKCGGTTVGYIAVCFCYSIEFGGRDAYIDEFFLEEGSRGLGLGTKSIAHIVEELRLQGIRAVSLEIASDNNLARGFYLKSGFEPRDLYSLMTRLL